jgi:hypothetical protein
LLTEGPRVVSIGKPLVAEVVGSGGRARREASEECKGLHDMKKMPHWPAGALTWLVVIGLAATPPAQATGQNPLPSWHEGQVKEAIMAFVEIVTCERAYTSPLWYTPAH